LTADGPTATHTLRVRRYRCRPCAAIVTVLPRGATRARHFSATAIALACVMYALSGTSLRSTRERVSPWRSAEPGWPVMGRWLAAIARGSIFASVRAWPERWSRRRQAERVAQAVLAVATGPGSLAVRAFAGAERLACAWRADGSSHLQPAGLIGAGPNPGRSERAISTLSVKHWNRLLGGMLYAASPRVDWASLLRRSFEVDVLACPGCSGRLRVLGEVTDPPMVRLVLDSLGMPTDAPRVARARGPTEWLGEDVVA